MTTVRPAEPADAAGLLRMRLALWPEGSEAEHREEIERFFAGRARGRPEAVFVAESETGELVGFAELAIRPCCTEFASDAHPDNEESAAAHRAAGFTDVGLVRCFRKEL